MKPTTALPQARLAYAALAAVCFFWGTTYLGIRIALESLPPFYLIAIRYTISGAVLLLGSALSGARLPQGREWLRTAACGIICIGVGNGFLARAELSVSTGFAAIVYTTCPFWMAGIDALLPGGRMPRAATVAALGVGAAGVLLILAPDSVSHGIASAQLSGFLLLQLSVAGWTTGALLQKRVRTTVSPLVSGAVQQLAAGLAMFVPAAVWEKAPSHISARGEFALAYLIVFGSFVGFTAFIYSMSHLPAPLVSIYTFVNPVVAVFLGCALYGETFRGRNAIAMVVIFAGVYLVRRSESAIRQTFHKTESPGNERHTSAGSTAGEGVRRSRGS